MKNNQNSITNHILLGNNIEDLRIKARQIADESRVARPDLFNAEKAYIEYNLAYAPPFEKHFEVLRNLQGVAAEEARFKDEFRGFILLDVSKYLKHEKEDYWDISLKFFHDKQDVWKFIFLIDMTNSRVGEEMISKILSIIYCQVLDTRRDKETENKQFVKRECESNHLSCSSEVLEFLQEYLSKREESRNVISTFLIELSNKYGAYKTIDMKTLDEHLKSGDLVIKFMLSKDEYKLFYDMVERKEGRYGEKI